MHPRDEHGFSLVELLITLVVIGVLAAITIPALLDALDKSRQKRTVADLRLLGGGIETYAVDFSAYPVGSDFTALDALQIEYLDNPITKDAWSHDLLYTGTTLEYTLGSAGKEGGASLTLTAGGGPTKNFNDDIIFRLGAFIQWPEGTQN